MSSSGPRILLFGTPGAGKSSLLAALAQAAAAQPAVLQGKLVDESGALIELQKAVYQTKPEPAEAVPAGGAPATRAKRETPSQPKLDPTAQLTEYDIQVQPEEDGRSKSEAIVLDSSGKDAQEMLQSKQPFLDSHPMKKPILNADTVLLIVDASMPGKQLAEEFQQFARWLIDFHETRGWRTEVGDLPVYLVLNKCDLLARPNDTFSMWMQRIEEGKRRIDQKFRDYLKTQGTGFGSIQMRVWATSIKRPALADRPAKSQEPFGVAELFRQCLQSASDYAQRRHASQYRLHNLVIAMTGLVALLVLIVGFLMSHQPEPGHDVALTEQLATLLPKPGKEADRLRPPIPKLEARLKELTAIQENPEFANLPSEKKEQVEQYRNELMEYLKKYQESQTDLKPPHTAKDEKEYKKLKEKVDKFVLPETHAKEWEHTRLGQLVKQRRDEYARVETALKDQEKWFRDQSELNKEILKRGNKIYSRLLDGQKVDPAEVTRWNLSYSEQKAPRSEKRAVERIAGTHMNYGDLEKFEQVKRAHKTWNTSKAQLQRMYEDIQSQLQLQ